MYRVDQGFRSHRWYSRYNFRYYPPGSRSCGKIPQVETSASHAEKLQEWIKRCACYSEDIKINHSMVNDEIISILKRPNGHGPVLRPAVGPPCPMRK